MACSSSTHPCSTDNHSVHYNDGKKPNSFLQQHIESSPACMLQHTHTHVLTPANKMDDAQGVLQHISKISKKIRVFLFGTFLKTADNQFGFKKGIGCNYTVRAARGAVENIVNGGTFCAIDLSKPFDKVNHFALFSKLMKRHIPNELLTLLERWLTDSYSCVKWKHAWSIIFKPEFGVRQGSFCPPSCSPFMLMIWQSRVYGPAVFTSYCMLMISC